MATISIFANTVRPSVDRRSNDTIFRAGTFSWQDPVHSWKAGPGEVMTVEKHSAPLSDLLVNPWLNKSKRVFSSGGARTHTTREMKNSSPMLYQLSYQGLMLREAILLRYILIPIFLIIFHHYLIFLETRPSWKGQ